ncbi:MAG: ATP-dependent helicase DinG, partial [Acidimicrobiaceae bacterium]|nr:ATP-dependent helicase DinG [Acidimicrobiaceae bacterium]
RAGPAAFRVVDLPRAATLLAQGAGRLIRTATDRGVVAVLDPRLASASYRWPLINALPPMRRTKDRAEVDEHVPRRQAVSAYLHEKNGDLELAARLYADAARNAPNLAERDHQMRQAVRLNQHLQQHR